MNSCMFNLILGPNNHEDYITITSSRSCQSCLTPVEACRANRGANLNYCVEAKDLWSQYERRTQIYFSISYAPLCIGFTVCDREEEALHTNNLPPSSPPLPSSFPPSAPNRPFQVPKEVAAIPLHSYDYANGSCIFKLLIIRSPLRILVGYVALHWDRNI